MKKFETLTNEELDILKNPTKTTKELIEILQCGHATIHRWRKKLNVQVIKGRKKGKKLEELKSGKKCGCPVCKKEIYYTKKEIEDKKIKCCSRKCLFEYDEYKKNLSKVLKKSWEKPSKGRKEGIKKRTKENTPEYTRYKNKVHRLSEKVYSENKEIINPNNYKRTLAGIKDGWQLDHIISVRYGFDNNIPAEVLCEVENLRMLPWQKNLERNRK